MRIRSWNAFASNNSGSYTIVGRFTEAATAEAIAELLRPVLAEHSEWFAAQTGEEIEDEPPLHRFLREQGLELDEHAGLGHNDDWPEHGPPPEVVAVGNQVLVHCDYTVTMPRFIGELFFARGGRVDVELDHAHHPVVVLMTLWIPFPRSYKEPEQSREDLAAVMDALREGPLTVHASDRIPAAWRPGPWGPVMEVGVVFEDLVEGMASVRAVVQGSPAEIRVRVFEAHEDGGDPLAFLRGERSTVPGEHKVLLWSVGPDRAQALKAIRRVKGGGLQEAKAVLEALPVEILGTANRRDAEEAVRVLREAGADAELLGPQEQRPR